VKKMTCLFQRTFHDRSRFTITPEVTPGCEWVLNGEGVASRKWDGTACAVIDGRLYKRYDAKKHSKTGEYKPPPGGAIPCDEPDSVTGHWPHWVPVDGSKPEDKHHVVAWLAGFDLTDRTADLPEGLLCDGTYELIGPPINGNAECADRLMFKRHGDDVREVPRSFHELRAYLQEHAIEGVVFAHPDGRMCKIRRDDFGFLWGHK
jgi:hypothetical protein